ncbi:cytochrome c3 family protein [Melioribacter sp. OK-6-Me]|uniref:cytochrome c3 family protein n=1 Tax=unclassified Melioribacter TaxID=2627329 RepID=UPI003EDB32EA
MKYIKYYLVLSLIFVLAACSDVQEEITPPAQMSVHGTGFLSQSSDNFHGKKLTDNSMESCKQCHASNYSGGTSGVSCVNCHPAINVHVDGILLPNSDNFHGRFIAATNWNLSQCAQCHGENYTGGYSSPQCTNCHNKAGGPEACTTCHGDFYKGDNIAPPQATNNAKKTTDPAVGAHQAHLNASILSNQVACTECHIIPSYFEAPGHIDNTQHAEVLFGAFSSSGPSNPSYDFVNNTCRNTYCHGNFEFKKENSEYQFIYTADKITGNNFSPKWNQVDGSQSACGTCHGLPPTGHESYEIRACGICHEGIVDKYGNIIDKSKHINGRIDLF